MGSPHEYHFNSTSIDKKIEEKDSMKGGTRREKHKNC
jgi:hypothetical protein